MKVDLYISDKEALQKVISLLPPEVAVQPDGTRDEASAELCIVERGALPFEDLNELCRKRKVIVLVPSARAKEIMEAMTEGAFDVIPLDSLEAHLPSAVDRVVKKAEEEKDFYSTHPQELVPCATCAIVGHSYPIQDLCKKIVVTAETDAPVLITGETGTGKELVAESIASLSDYDKPFEIINCAAIPESLLEAELFGYEKGAFTGAVSSKPGRLVGADKGTVFFDEIGELPLNLQGKLLRFLQTQSFHPVGATKEVQVRIRIIAATNRDLHRMIRRGTFREDLFFRLSVIHLHIPPLRERKQDMLALVQCFILRFSSQMRKKVRGASKKFLAALLDYDWPGNIRQLENVVRAAIVRARGEILTTLELPPLTEHEEFSDERSDDSMNHLTHQAIAEHPGQAYPWLIEKAGRQLLEMAMEKEHGNQSRAARLLGINRLTLRRMLSGLPRKG